MKKYFTLTCVILVALLLSGCGEQMVKWSEEAKQKMVQTGENVGESIREKGKEIAGRLDSIAQDTENVQEENVKEESTDQSANSFDTKPEETPKVEPAGWNQDDHDVMSNKNVQYALKLLAENEYEFTEYTYAEQFFNLTSDEYGKFISIAGTLAEISPVTEEFDANFKTTLYADGIRSILLINVEGMSNANNQSMIVFSNQPKDNFILDGVYSISGLLAGTTMYKITVHRQDQTETNFVNLHAMVADEDLIFPMPYEEYFFGYLAAYDDEEFVQRLLNETR
jgi:outer membrane murein-binding lipoprotein Lpp